MATLELRNVNKSYGSGLADTLKNIELAIDSGEFLILVGPSGCGKSTLMNCIAGLEDISGGAILVDGADISGMSPKDRDIAMVFQSYALYPTMTVKDNIAFGLKMRKLPPAEIEAEVARVAKLLQIEHLLARKPGQLSGGQQQRVAMGRALARRPKIYLFDEPLSNLDAKLRVEMRTEIKLMHQRLKTTTVYVTHDQIEAMTLATRIAVMNGGIVQQLGTPHEIYNHPANLFVATFMGSPSMNLLDVQVNGQGQATLETSSGPLQVITGLAPGQYKIGLRAEHLTDTSLADRNAETLEFDAEVDVVEPAGSDTFIVTRIGQAEFTARTRGDMLVSPGDSVRLAFDPSRLHFFDLDGQRVSP